MEIFTISTGNVVVFTWLLLVRSSTSMISKSICFCFIIFPLFYVLNFTISLKIKLSSLKILKLSNLKRPDWIDDEVFIEYLTLEGPYKLLGSLIGLETSINFRSIAVSKCFYMNSEIILDIFKEFND